MGDPTPLASEFVDMWMKSRENTGDSDVWVGELKYQDFSGVEMIGVGGFEGVENQPDDDIPSEDESENEINAGNLTKHDETMTQKMLDDMLETGQSLQKEREITVLEDTKVTAWIRILTIGEGLNGFETTARDIGRAILDMGQSVFFCFIFACPAAKVWFLRKVARPYLLQRVRKVRRDKRLDSPNIQSLAKKYGVHRISSKSPGSSTSHGKSKS